MSRNWEDLKPGDYVSVQLAASAYPPHMLRGEGKCVTHVARIDEHGDVARVCSKIKTDSILPDASMFDEWQVDCGACLARLRKLKVSPPETNRRVLPEKGQPLSNNQL